MPGLLTVIGILSGSTSVAWRGEEGDHLVAEALVAADRSLVTTHDEIHVQPFADVVYLMLAEHDTDALGLVPLVVGLRDLTLRQGLLSNSRRTSNSRV